MQNKNLPRHLIMLIHSTDKGKILWCQDYTSLTRKEDGNSYSCHLEVRLITHKSKSLACLSKQTEVV